MKKSKKLLIRYIEFFLKKYFFTSIYPFFVFLRTRKTFKMTNEFKLIHLIQKEHFVLDSDKNGIYNAFMVCKPGNEILLKAINKIVENVKHRYYGSNYLEPTGPNLLIKYFSEQEKNSLILKHKLVGPVDSDKLITYNNIPILGCYRGYLKERDLYSKKQHYAELWKNRTIYK